MIDVNTDKLHILVDRIKAELAADKEPHEIAGEIKTEEVVDIFMGDDPRISAHITTLADRIDRYFGTYSLLVEFVNDWNYKSEDERSFAIYELFVGDPMSGGDGPVFEFWSEYEAQRQANRFSGLAEAIVEVLKADGEEPLIFVEQLSPMLSDETIKLLQDNGVPTINDLLLQHRGNLSVLIGSDEQRLEEIRKVYACFGLWHDFIYSN